MQMTKQSVYLHGTLSVYVVLGISAYAHSPAVQNFRQGCDCVALENNQKVELHGIVWLGGGAFNPRTLEFKARLIYREFQNSQDYTRESLSQKAKNK